MSVLVGAWPLSRPSRVRAKDPMLIAGMSLREDPTQEVLNSKVPAGSSAAAAISLLTDSDHKVVDACRRQLLEWGESVQPLLVEASQGPDEPLAQRAGEVLRSVNLEIWLRKIREYASDLPGKGQIDGPQLEAGAMLIAELDSGGRYDRKQVGSLLDQYAAELEPAFEGKSAATCAKILAEYLAGQLGYAGSQSSFYSVSNVQFNEVVSVRRGVPVSLTLLYILVARRAGLEVAGVSLPDHFLVRVKARRPVLLDPYHQGRQVTRNDCVRYLRNAGYSLHTTSYLEDVHDRQILDCLLRNLLRVYGYQEDHELCSVLEKARQAFMRG